MARQCTEKCNSQLACSSWFHRLTFYGCLAVLKVRFQPGYRPINNNTMQFGIYDWELSAANFIWANESCTAVLPLAPTLPQCHIEVVIQASVFWAGFVHLLVPGRCGSNFSIIIFKLIIQKITLVTCCEIALRWMPQNLTIEKSILIQVMALCHQTTSLYLSQFWPRSVSPYGITRPQWVN